MMVTQPVHEVRPCQITADQMGEETETTRDACAGAEASARRESSERRVKYLACSAPLDLSCLIRPSFRFQLLRSSTWSPGERRRTLPEVLETLRPGLVDVVRLFCRPSARCRTSRAVRVPASTANFVGPAAVARERAASSFEGACARWVVFGKGSSSVCGTRRRRR